MDEDWIEIYTSPNGDRWSLNGGAGDEAVVRHVPNVASGGCSSDTLISEFLSSTQATPQGEALLGMLAEFASRSARKQSYGARPSVDLPAVEGLLLAAVRVRTFAEEHHLTNASGFFFARDERLFLVTSRHVLHDTPSDHFPDRLEIELHVDSSNLGASTWCSLPLYEGGLGLWREGTDGGGDVDVAVLEVIREQLPQSAVLKAFSPANLPKTQDVLPVGASVLIVGFPLGFHDSLHHLPVVRQGVIASAFGLRFQGKGCFITDARTHRGTSGAPVVMSDAISGMARGDGALPWKLLGIHSSTIDMGERDIQVDESLGLNSAWYADILMALTNLSGGRNMTQQNETDRRSDKEEHAEHEALKPKNENENENEKEDAARDALDRGDRGKIYKTLDELNVSTTESGKDQSSKPDREGSNSSSKDLDEQSD
ncbi:serine protease [Caballeronia sp. LZ035]|uniref:S1 family peptidase n=1 Tax=Caballeronia sp. LZ035 TaxID=3038568 RepID=UPI00286B187B|nr:serine protease [Caballeronia sp. LZ035]